MPCLRTWKFQGLSRLRHLLVFKRIGKTKHISQHTKSSHLDCGSMLVIIPGDEVEEEHSIWLKCRQALHQDCVPRKCCSFSFLLKLCSQLRSNHAGQSVSNTGRKRIMASHRWYQAIHLEYNLILISSMFTLKQSWLPCLSQKYTL